MMHRRSHTPGSHAQAFTLIELLACLAIIGVLIAILLPALSSSRRAAQSATCLAQLKQIGLAFEFYKSDNKEAYPFVDDSVNIPDGRAEPIRMLSSLLGVPLPQVVAALTTDAGPPWRCPADPVIARRYGTSYRYELWPSFPALGQSSATIVSNNANAGLYPAIMQELLSYHNPSSDPNVLKGPQRRHFLKHDGSVGIR